MLNINYVNSKMIIILSKPDQVEQNFDNLRHFGQVFYMSGDYIL